MRGTVRDRIHAALARARRVERRELREFRRWVERTSVLVPPGEWGLQGQTLVDGATGRFLTADSRTDT